MIGLFDSGVGGCAVLKELRAIAPKEDIVFLKDTKNAPYGTKSMPELIRIAERNARLLALEGAEKILIGCCTASAAYPHLSTEARELCVPIIGPTAMAALAATKTGRIGVIATEATVRSGAFSSAIKNICPHASVTELCAQELVPMIEGGLCDENLDAQDKAFIENLLSPLYNSRMDTIVLGCTHFPHISRLIGRIFCGAEIISSAKEGAKYMKKFLSGEGHSITKYMLS